MEGGKVRIGWELEDDGPLRLKWVESGGPPATPSDAPGYGTKLIQTAVNYSLGGHVEQNFTAGGLETEIVFRVEDAPSPG